MLLTIGASTHQVPTAATSNCGTRRRRVDTIGFQDARCGLHPSFHDASATAPPICSSLAVPFSTEVDAFVVAGSITTYPPRAPSTTVQTSTTASFGWHGHLNATCSRSPQLTISMPTPSARRIRLVRQHEACNSNLVFAHPSPSLLIPCGTTFDGYLHRHGHLAECCWLPHTSPKRRSRQATNPQRGRHQLIQNEEAFPPLTPSRSVSAVLTLNIQAPTKLLTGVSVWRYGF